MSRDRIFVGLTAMIGFSLIGLSYLPVQPIIHAGVLLLLPILVFLKRNVYFGFQQCLLLLFVLSIFASMLLSVHFRDSIIPTLYLFFVFFVSVALFWLIRSDDQFRTFLFGVLLGFLVVGIRNFFYGNEGWRAGGVAGQANALGLLSGTGVIVSFFYYRYFLLRFRKLDYLVCFFTLGVSFYWLVSSSSRGAFVSTIFSLGLMYVLQNRRVVNNTFSLLFIFISCLFLFWDTISTSLLFARLSAIPSAIGVDWLANSWAPNTATIGGAEDDTRVYLAEIAVEGFIANPVFGNGAGTFGNYSFYSYSHSTHLEILFSFGLSGLVFFYGIFFSALSVGLRGLLERDHRSGPLISLVVFFMLAGVSIPNFQSKIQIPIYVIIFVLYRFMVLRVR